LNSVLAIFYMTNVHRSAPYQAINVGKKKITALDGKSTISIYPTMISLLW